MANNTKDTYESLNEIEKNLTYNKDYAVEFIDVVSPISIVAIHGGGIEAATTEIARALAEKGFYKYYSFKGIRNEQSECSENLQLHITSHKFLDPICLRIVGDSIATLSFHGCDEEEALIYVGGKNFVHAAFIKNALKENGFPVENNIRKGLEGYGPLNICNRNMRGMGVQIEISRGMRANLFSDDWRRIDVRRKVYNDIFDVVPKRTQFLKFLNSLFIANQQYLNIP